MDWKDFTGQLFLDGGPSTCQFAITDACNAKCSFCNFSRESASGPKTLVQKEAGIGAIDSLYRNGVRYIIFTGGEPTLNPSLDDFIKHCTDIGVKSLLVTNGSTLSAERAGQLADLGLCEAIISVDSCERAVSEENRGLPGVWDRIAEANRMFAERSTGHVASVTLSRITGDLSLLPQTLDSLGFQGVTFSFPLTGLESNYLGCKESELVDYSPEEIHNLIDMVIDLRKHYNVLNPLPSLEDMHRYLRKEPQKFVCLGGFKQFYLDWNLNLWRCCNWKKPMCRVSEFNGSQIVRDGCTSCMVDCFRDASVLQQCAISLADGIHAACCGRWDSMLRCWTDLRNAESIGAVIKDSHWLGC